MYWGHVGFKEFGGLTKYECMEKEMDYRDFVPILSF